MHHIAVIHIIALVSLIPTMLSLRMLFPRNVQRIRLLPVTSHTLSSLQQMRQNADRSSGVSSSQLETRRMAEYAATAEKLLKNGDELTALSFFKFADKKKHKPITSSEKLDALKEELSKLNVKGTLLVSANEGYNGAFCVPTRYLVDFYRSLVQADPAMFIDLDLNIGQTFSQQATDSAKFPFKKLIIKQKRVVLTDGFSDDASDSLDFTDAGEEIDPQMWHEELSHTSQAPLIIDCRNDYESSMGTFEGSVPLNTTTFAESFDKLDAMFASVDKGRRVLTFCTGGIRCIKVNAYLKQKMGMTNIARLQKGIIHYEQWIQSEEPSVQTLFKGENFLFDRRRMDQS